MDSFSRHDLAMLIEQPRSNCVSLYLPTHPTDPEFQRDRIELGNLIHRAEAELARRGLRRSDVLDILGPARALVEDEGFWQCRGDGLAVFLRSGWWRAFRLPHPFDELAVVSDRFHIFPLLPLMAGDTRFFVLALSEHEARLLAGTRSGLRVVPVPGMPHGVKDALRYDEPLKTRGHHLGQRIGAKVRTVMHGQGIGAEVQKERLGRYLHAVHHAVHTVLREQRAPLVLAGVNSIRAAYRDITDYPHILATGISGSPDRVPAAELHTHAWALVEPEIAQGRTETAAACEQALGTGEASDDLNEIRTAAETGRVEALFLRATAPEREQEPLESAAVDTIRAGGTVYAVPEATDMPGRGSVAALFRY